MLLAIWRVHSVDGGTPDENAMGIVDAVVAIVDAVADDDNAAAAAAASYYASGHVPPVFPIVLVSDRWYAR